MYYYRAFGHLIKSELDLNGFVPTTSGKPDVNVFKQSFNSGIDSFPEDLKINRIPDGYQFLPPYAAQYKVRNGNRIDLLYNKGNEDLLNAPFYGYIPAALLLQKGMLVLHGSTVTVNGTTVLIAGGKGFGKSSLTAAFIARGHKLVSDDISAVSVTGSSFEILSGIPIIKLWPESLELLSSNAYVSCSALYHGFDKQLCILKADRFCSKRMELDAIVYLRRNKTGRTVFELIPKMSDKMYLVSCSQYFVSYPDIYSNEDKRNSFKTIDKLARHKPIYRLSCINDFSLIDSACELIENEFG